MSASELKLGYVLIHVNEIDPLKDWYCKHFSLTVEHQFEDQLVVLSGSQGCKLVLEKGRPINNPQQLCLMFEVDDVDSKYEELKSRGIEFKVPPEDQPYGMRTTILRDPAGHALEIYKPL